MPTKKQTITAAEKRTIKAEISNLNKAHRKIDNEYMSHSRRIAKEIKKLEKSEDQFLASAERELSQIQRRLAILYTLLYPLKTTLKTEH